MKKTILASAILMAFVGSATAANTFGTITIDNASANKTELGNEANGVVKIVGNDSSYAVLANDDLTIRGKEIHIERETTGYTEAFRLAPKGTGILGGAETDLISVKGGDGLVLLAGDGGATFPTLTVTAKTVNFDVTGAGIWAQNNTEASPAPQGHTTLTINADNINIKAGNQGVVAFSNSEINLNGNVNIDAAKYALDVRGNSTVNINQNADKTVVLKGDILFETPGPDENSGSVVGANVNINLTGANSSWTGNVLKQYPKSFESKPNVDELTAVTELKLVVANGAKWTPTAVTSSEDSEIITAYQPLNNLTLDGGIVNLNQGIEVQVEKFSGKGQVNLATDGSTAGKFAVSEAVAGSTLDVQLMDTKMEKALTSDQVTAEQAKKLMGNVSGKDVAVTTQVQEGMYKPGFGIDEKGTTTTAPVNTLMQSNLELASAAPLAINRILMNDVRKRLGDIRAAEGTSGAWARYDGGRLSGSNGLENDFHTIQVGVDTQPTNDPVRFGVAFAYTMSDTDYARGTADMDAYSLAGYGLWLGDNGQFVDVVARMATTKTDMTVDGTKKGEMDNVALSLSGEFGWRFDVMNNFFVEPQIEGTYTYVESDNLALNDGSTYAYDAVDSFLGRAGVVFGMKCPNNKGNVYARVSAVHEFLGDKAVTGGDGTVMKLDGKDTWVEYGLGANFNLTPNTYVWADLERTSGSTLEEDYRATVGVRYAW